MFFVLIKTLDFIYFAKFRHHILQVFCWMCLFLPPAIEQTAFLKETYPERRTRNVHCGWIFESEQQTVAGDLHELPCSDQRHLQVSLVTVCWAVSNVRLWIRFQNRQSSLCQLYIIVVKPCGFPRTAISIYRRTITVRIVCDLLSTIMLPMPILPEDCCRPDSPPLLRFLNPVVHARPAKATREEAEENA